MRLKIVYRFVQSDRWFYIDDGPLFETLPHVIDHYSRCADGLPVLLKMALPPDGNPPVVIQNIPAPPARKQRSGVLPATPSLSPAVSSPALSVSPGKSQLGRVPIQRADSAVSILQLKHNNKEIFTVQTVMMHFTGTKYSTGQRDSSTNMRIKCVQYGRFKCRMHANYKLQNNTVA